MVLLVPVPLDPVGAAVNEVVKERKCTLADKYATCATRRHQGCGNMGRERVVWVYRSGERERVPLAMHWPEGMVKHWKCTRTK